MKTITLSPATEAALAAYTAQLREDIPADVRLWSPERFLGAMQTDLLEQVEFESVSLGGHVEPVGLIEKTTWDSPVTAAL